jgi:hypothetical protein
MKSVKSNYLKRLHKISKDVIREGQASGEYEARKVLVPSAKAISLLDEEECLPMMMTATAAMKMDPADLAVATEAEGRLVGHHVDRPEVAHPEVDPVDQLHPDLQDRLDLLDRQDLQDMNVLQGETLTRLYSSGLLFFPRSQRRLL